MRKLINKVEFHCHTSNSYDCKINIEERLKHYSENGFTHLAITDHDSVLKRADYKIIEAYNKLTVIPAIEVSTHVGHVILLNCRYKPFFNSLLFLVIWSYFWGCDIYVPHPLRKGTGLLLKYVEEGVSTSYICWFFKHVKYVEVWNPRDSSRHKTVVDKNIFNILLNQVLWVFASDSHYQDDIFLDGCTFSGVGIDDLRVQNFFKNKIQAGDVKVNFKIRSFLRYIKSSIRYAHKYFYA